MMPVDTLVKPFRSAIRQEIVSPWRALAHQTIPLFKHRRLSQGYLKQSEELLAINTAGHSVNPGIKTPQQALTELISDQGALSAVLPEITSGDYPKLFAGVLALLDGHFVEQPTFLGEASLILAALCFTQSSRQCHLVCASDERCLQLLEKYQDRFQTRGKKLVHSQGSDPKRYQGDICLVGAKTLLADFVASASLVNADIHQTAIASRFGEKRLNPILPGLQVVLIDQVDRQLLDHFLRPLTASRPRDLPAMDQVLAALTLWADQLPEPVSEELVQVEKTQAQYVGEMALREYNEFAQLTGFWRSERVLTELVDYALTVKHCLKQGVDYRVDQGRLIVLDRHNGQDKAGQGFPAWIQQLLEFREQLEITPLTEIVLQASYQRFFRERFLLIGTGIDLKTNSADLYRLYQRETVCLLSHTDQNCRLKRRFLRDFFDLKKQILQVSAHYPQLSHLLCLDSRLYQVIKLELEKDGSPFNGFQLIDLNSDNHGFTPKDLTASEMLVIGRSVTGRTEALLRQWLKGDVLHLLLKMEESVIQALKDNDVASQATFNLEQLLPAFWHSHKQKRQQQNNRQQLCQEQIKFLQADYWLEDQWI